MCRLQVPRGERASRRAQASAKALRQEPAWSLGWMGESGRGRGGVGLVGHDEAFRQGTGRVFQVSAEPLPRESNDPYCSLWVCR